MRHIIHDIRNPRRQSSTRSAFTIVEMLIVILIIAVLAGMILPAVNNVRSAARDAQVVNDIKNLEAAIATFKLKYGVEPPSVFVVGTQDADYNTPEGQHSRSVMRQIWPNYSPKESTSNLPGQIINSQFSPASPVVAQTLNGAECLAFFLGGPGVFGDDNNPDGFSADPTNPFKAGGARVGPFIEFNTARMTDVNGNGFREIKDTYPSQTKPYLYLSSNNGRGYDSGALLTSSLQIEVHPNPSDPNPNTFVSPYLKKDSGWNDGTDQPVAQNRADYWNGQSFQIISPGVDEKYGTGGLFDQNEARPVMKTASPNRFRTRELRQPESDNITNFNNGRLGALITK